MGKVGREYRRCFFFSGSDENEHLEMQNNRLDDHYQRQIYKR